MGQNNVFVKAVLQRLLRYSALAAAPALLLYAGQAAAQQLASPIVQAITLPGGQNVTSFDISFVDPANQVYVLADRTNAVIDAIDTTSRQVIAQISSSAAPFAGTGGGNNNLAGPDGVLIENADNEIFAGNGPFNGASSSVLVFDLFSGSLVTSIDTGGQARADELCWDPVDKLILVANDADNPPYDSFISTTDNAVHGLIFMSGAAGQGPNATNGIEQCQWDPVTGNFFQNIPEVNGPGNDTVPGQIIEISPKTHAIVATITPTLAQCAGPQGMALGPAVGGGAHKKKAAPTSSQVLIGCNVSSSTIVIDTATATIVKTIANEGGSDEVAYNSGDNTYYLAESSPSYANTQRLGAINAGNLTRDISVQTGIKSGIGGVTRGTNHSVDADPTNNRIYVPIASTSGGSVCSRGGGSDTQGCIAVFGSPE